MPVMDLSMVEQRYDAVRDVLAGATVKGTYEVDFALHRWLVRYANEGLAALGDKGLISLSGSQLPIGLTNAEMV